MCFDPVSATLLASAVGGNAIAGNAEGKANSKFQIANINADRDQLNQNVAEAKARQDVGDKYDANAQAFAGQNQGTLGDVFTQFQQPAQLATQAGAMDNRNASIQAALGAGPPPTSDIALRRGTPDIVKAEMAKRLGDVFTDSQAKAAATAKVGSYGDTMGANSVVANGGARNINTTNTLARGNISLLPQEQDLAGFQVRKPIFRPSAPDVPSWVGPVKMLSNIAGIAAGSGAGAKTLGGFMPNPTMLGDATLAYGQQPINVGTYMW